MKEADSEDCRSALRTLVVWIPAVFVSCFLPRLVGGLSADSTHSGLVDREGSFPLFESTAGYQGLTTT